ncbi:MAG TPA: YceI family protein [Luteibaculaceae bacterium]|nr:YceI family protein [Luteibaculaceae bacterium]
MKKMLLTGFAAILVAVSAIAANPKAENGKYTIDAKASKLKWVGKKVTGEHTGYISFKSGVITTKGNSIASGNAVVDMTSITCTDLTDAEYNGKLVGHLKAEDFFDVAKFNESEFKLNTITPISGAKEGANNYTVKGTLTIKGVTQSIEFPAKVEIKGKTLVVRADVTFDRTKYGIKYGSKSFVEGIGDKAISDEVQLSFALVAKAS